MTILRNEIKALIREVLLESIKPQAPIKRPYKSFGRVIKSTDGRLKKNKKRAMKQS